VVSIVPSAKVATFFRIVIVFLLSMLTVFHMIQQVASLVIMDFNS